MVSGARLRRGAAAAPRVGGLSSAHSNPYAGIGRPSEAGATNTPGGCILADHSRTSDVGARYARALFDLAVETDALEAVDSDLKDLKAMIGASVDLRLLLVSPAISAEDKAKGLDAIAARAKLDATTRKFLGLLAANRRVSALAAIIEAFARLVEARRGVVSAQVVTAIPMSAAQSASLATTLRNALGKDPQIETRVDPAILGGVKVRVGSRLYDASLKSKLDSLKFALKRA